MGSWEELSSKLSSWEMLSDEEPSVLLTSDDEMVQKQVELLKKQKKIENKNLRIESLALGRRKQRRFENEFLLIPILEEEEEGMADLYFLQKLRDEDTFVSFKRKIAPATFEAYIDGDLALSLNNMAVHNQTKKQENGLFRVDKKIRKHLNRVSIKKFVFDLEENLIENIQQTNNKEVILCVESSFQRMLLHGIAQFHNIDSRSIEHSKVKLIIPQEFKPSSRLSSFLREIN